MKVFCVQVEHESSRLSENYTNHTLWSTLEGARKALKEERAAILRNPGWSESSIETDEDNRFSAYEEDPYFESYLVTIFEEPVHEG